jgi:hypothetical protein
MCESVWIDESLWQQLQTQLVAGPFAAAGALLSHTFGEEGISKEDGCSGIEFGHLVTVAENAVVSAASRDVRSRSRLID